MRRIFKSEDAPEGDSASVSDAVSTEPSADSLPKGYTPKKGRATPKRRDVERQKGIVHGPVAPAPKTRKEARQREDARYAGLSKEERKALKDKEAEERRRMQEYRRERMAAGDDDYVLPRDKGPVRRFARNWVDSFWSPISALFPLVLILLIGTMIRNSYVQIAVQYLMYAFFAILVIETIRIMVTISHKAKKEFPNSNDTGFRLGWYALMRAMQPRRWRNPVPQVAVATPWKKKTRGKNSAAAPADDAKEHHGR